MTDLSPAAQAVLDATSGTFGNYQFAARGQMIAAALRAAANCVAPEAMPHRRKIRKELLAIAAELDGGVR